MKCEICGTTENLRCAPLMTGEYGFDRKPTERPICRECFTAWYEGGGTTPEEILKYRKIEAKP